MAPTAVLLLLLPARLLQALPRGRLAPTNGYGAAFGVQRQRLWRRGLLGVAVAPVMVRTPSRSLSLCVNTSQWIYCAASYRLILRGQDAPELCSTLRVIRDAAALRFAPAAGCSTRLALAFKPLGELEPPRLPFREGAGAAGVAAA
jgi:hypothetical protein